MLLRSSTGCFWCCPITVWGRPSTISTPTIVPSRTAKTPSLNFPASLAPSLIYRQILAAKVSIKLDFSFSFVFMLLLLLLLLFLLLSLLLLSSSVSLFYFIFDRLSLLCVAQIIKHPLSIKLKLISITYAYIYIYSTYADVIDLARVVYHQLDILFSSRSNSFDLQRKKKRERERR